MKDKRLFWVWSDMRQRCTNPNHRSYNNYGGRGIRVCKRWDSFRDFLADMGERPRGMMLERRNNDGHYSPTNCRWATRQEQNSNRRNCIMIQDGAESVTLKEICRRRGLKYRPIVKRIQDRGWPIAMALNVPVGQPPHSFRKLVSQ